MESDGKNSIFNLLNNIRLVSTMQNRKYMVAELVVQSLPNEESHSRTESGTDYVIDLLFC